MKTITDKIRIVTVLGARTQFIKAATVSRVISKRQELEEVNIHTGQHFDPNMSQVFFDEMQIPKPDYFLNINSLSHGAMTGRMLEEIEKILIEEKPDIVLVYGDTNTTLAGALAAKKMNIKVAHVEAGLRSFNNNMPEEINRTLTDRISNYLFCPTQTAIENLQKEGFNNLDCEIILCGDVMYDAALFYSELIKNKENHISEKYHFPNNKFGLVTIHREENTNSKERLESILNALKLIEDKISLFFPLHPRTRKIIESYDIDFYNYFQNSVITKPLGYLNMIDVISRSEIVITDSGGLQKEAYFFKKPCVTIRDETEWVELIDCGVNIIAGSDTVNIYNAVERSLKAKYDFNNKLYGDGNTAYKIVNQLCEI